MGPRPIGRGDAQVRGVPGPDPLASMGPRPIGRGDTEVEEETGGDGICFNGAATNWSRRYEQAQATGGPARASMGPRPIGRGDECDSVQALEMVPASMGPRPIGRGDQAGADSTTAWVYASMGPRPIGRGDGDIPHCGSRCLLSFNGAATNWSRRLLEFVQPHGREASFNGAATNWSRRYRPRDGRCPQP